MLQLRPTFSESWYRVAALKVRLRGSTQISRQYYRGDRWYVVRDPAGNQYHRLSAAAYRFVGLLDGSRTVAEAWDLIGGQLADDAPTQPEVIQILSQLHAANLLEANITADATVLLRRHKQLRKRELQGRLMNILFPRIPLWDPDRFLVKWMPVMRGVLSMVGAIIWCIVVVTAISLLAPRWSELRGGASDAIDPHNWPFLWATFVLIKLIHELGHAFTCRRLGGEIHEMGIMFLVFIPAPYVEASSAWSLPSRWQRALVGAGGMIFELFVAAIMAMVWLNTPQGRLLHQMAYNAMLIASVSTVMFNANPLLRYDGYYILSDMLEIPNLQQKATEYALGLVKRHVFRVKSPLPLPPPGQRVWLFLYAITSGIYRVFVGLLIIFIVTTKVPVLGVLMAIGGVVTWAVVPVYKIGNYLLLDAELHRKRVPATAFVLAVVAAIVLVLGFIPIPVHYDATGVLVAAQKSVLHAQTDGFIVKVCKHDNEYVHKDDIILLCENPDLSGELQDARAQLAYWEQRLNYDRVNEPTQFLADSFACQAVQDAANDKQKQYDFLTVRAPIDGTLIAPDLNQSPGRFVHRGEDLNIKVAQLDNCVANGFLDERDIALPFSGPDHKPPTSAKLRLAGNVSVELSGQVVWWGAAAVGELPNELKFLGKAGGGPLDLNPKDPNGNKLAKLQFPVIVAVDNHNRQYYTNQKVYMRFDLGKKPLAWQLYRRLGQLLQTHSSENKWM